MGSTNRTTNYELSQFVGNDKPSWLSDYNGDMAKIDTAIKARSVEAGAAQTTADTANGKADALDTRMGTAENNITALQNASTTDHTQIATNTANISKNAQDIVQLDAKIGHTQITIGDHTVTGAIAELAARPVTGDAEDISYDNTTSGLTATNVQEAIDEVKADIPDDATEIAYSNTQSRLSATTVQGAIDELAQSGGAGLSDVLIANGTGATASAQLTSLQSAYNGMTAAEKRNAYLDVLGHHVNISGGAGYYVQVSAGGTTEGFISITNAKLYTKDTAVGGATGNLTDQSSVAITMSLRTLK